MLDHVVTLIGKQAGALDGAEADLARGVLHRLGAELGRTDWLADRQACDIPFGDLHPDQSDAAVRAVLSDAPIDVIAQKTEGRRKLLLVADMESTLIRNEMLDELAALAGLRDRIAAITAQAISGERDFEAALIERVGLLAGLPEAALKTAAKGIRIMPGAETLVATMKAHGALTVLVSGGFRCFTSRVRETLGLDRDVANDLLVAAGRLTGAVALPVLDRRAKAETLIRLAAEQGIALEAAMAVGDGAHDLDMIAASGLGIAFHAMPEVAARAKGRIDHADLTALLFAQGYRRDEFV